MTNDDDDEEGDATHHIPGHTTTALIPLIHVCSTVHTSCVRACEEREKEKGKHVCVSSEGTREMDELNCFLETKTRKEKKVYVTTMYFSS